MRQFVTPTSSEEIIWCNILNLKISINITNFVVTKNGTQAGKAQHPTTGRNAVVSSYYCAIIIINFLEIIDHYYFSYHTIRQNTNETHSGQ